MKLCIVLIICLGFYSNCKGGLIRDKLFPKIKELYYKLFPCQRVCPPDSDLICVRNSADVSMILANKCELMKINQCYKDDYKIVHNGTCKNIPPDAIPKMRITFPTGNPFINR